MANEHNKTISPHWVTCSNNIYFTHSKVRPKPEDSTLDPSIFGGKKDCKPRHRYGKLVWLHKEDSLHLTLRTLVRLHFHAIWSGSSKVSQNLKKFSPTLYHVSLCFYAILGTGITNIPIITQSLSEKFLPRILITCSQKLMHPLM